MTDTPFTTFAYPVTGGTVNRTTPDRCSDVVNVKEYGAIGNGIADDTAAIQAAINAAFGPLSSPHGDSNPKLNKPLYLPAGSYRTTSSLYLYSILGGHIFGAGNGSTQIFFQPNTLVNGGDVGNNTVGFFNYSTVTTFTVGATLTGGTSGATGRIAAVASGTKAITLYDVTGIYSVGETVTDGTGGSSTLTVVSQYTPAIVCDGVGYTTFEGFAVYCSNSGGFDTSVTSMGFFLYQTGERGYTGGLNFRDMNIANFYIGVLGGADAGNVDACNFYNIQLNNCRLAGLRTVGYNCLDWGVYGGGASMCGTATTYNPVTVTSGNLGAAYSCVTGSIVTILNPAMSYNGVDILNAGGQAMSVLGGRSESQISIVSAASPIHVSGFSYGGQTLDGLWLDLTFSGNITVTGGIFNPANNAGAGIIARLGNNGKLTIDGIEWGAWASLCTFYGATNAEVTLRNAKGFFFDETTKFGANYTGRVMGWDLSPRAVADLPTANAKFRGLRCIVTDANATTLGSTVAGGGSNIVEVTCATTTWNISTVLN